MVRIKSSDIHNNIKTHYESQIAKQNQYSNSIYKPKIIELRGLEEKIKQVNSYPEKKGLFNSLNLQKGIATFLLPFVLFSAINVTGCSKDKKDKTPATVIKRSINDTFEDSVEDNFEDIPEKPINPYSGVKYDKLKQNLKLDNNQLNHVFDFYKGFDENSYTYKKDNITNKMSIDFCHCPNKIVYLINYIIKQVIYLSKIINKL